MVRKALRMFCSDGVGLPLTEIKKQDQNGGFRSCVINKTLKLLVEMSFFLR